MCKKVSNERNKQHEFFRLKKRKQKKIIFADVYKDTKNL